MDKKDDLSFLWDEIQVLGKMLLLYLGSVLIVLLIVAFLIG
jgi:hypothetical protein